MRRAHAGNYYEPLPQTSNEVEEENDRMANELRDKVGALKSLSIDIGNELKYQDKLLRDVDDDMDRTRGFLGNTMNRVLRLSKGSHNYYIVYLFFFSLFVFFVLYIVLKFR
ncbi:BET1 homolog [Tribolium castaneum]|uniref:BET1 homolog n=1 Tax=Tribolium castaneum TaxID=7070 RepID=D6X1L1_TRICA|nr:PREDICTED: BET1 homolog [Tribolium castaneum]EFA09340.1 BET1 homolog-like Protein [Tribolium castaneum]|eukprot:XP_969661.1 PREDICTED: BET1 homolog [Tribolium castaneum]